MPDLDRKTTSVNPTVNSELYFHSKLQSIDQQTRPAPACRQAGLAGIIVSADDFGKNSSTNKNILELLSLKKLHRVSVMINGNFSTEEIHLLLNSSCQLDLHLNFFNLLGNNPSSEKEINILSRLLIFFKNYLSGKIRASEVAADWDRQLEKFRLIFGKYPDGLNSHEHVHFFPTYFKLISALAKKSKVAYVRLGRKGFIQANSIVAWIIFCLRKINQRRFLTSALSSSDFLISLDWLGEAAYQKIKNLPDGEIELIIHPERAAELSFLKNWSNFIF